jgi:hypothetical protein
MNVPSGFYTTNDLLKRYGKSSKKTILNWRNKLGFPKPFFTSGDGGEAHYSCEEVHNWEIEQRDKTKEAS